jgi:hypothetical protein
MGCRHYPGSTSVTRPDIRQRENDGQPNRT